MDTEPAAVVRRAWDAFLAGDIDGALRYFAPDAEWRTPGDFPGPHTFRGHDQLRVVFGWVRPSEVRRVVITDITDMGSFVLAHGAVYLEHRGEALVERVTLWRVHVDNGVITSVHAEALPSGDPWPEPHGEGDGG